MASTGKNEKRMGEMLDELKLALVGAGDKDLADVVTSLTLLTNALGAHDAAAKATALSALVAKYLATPAEVADGDATYLVTTIASYLKIAGYMDSNGAIAVNGVNFPAKTPRTTTAISTTYAAGAAATTSEAIYVGDCRAVTIKMKDVITRVGATITNTYTFLGSMDGTNFEAIDCMVGAAGLDAPFASVAVSETTTVTKTNWASFFPGFGVNYLKVVSTPGGTDADDTDVCTVLVLVQPQ